MMFPLYIIQVRHLTLHGYAQWVPIPYILVLIPICWWIGQHYDIPLRGRLVAWQRSLPSSSTGSIPDQPYLNQSTASHHAS